MPIKNKTITLIISFGLIIFSCANLNARKAEQDNSEKDLSGRDLSIKGRVIKTTGKCGRFCSTEKYWIEAKSILYSHLGNDVHDSQIAIISVCATQGLLLGETYTFFLNINNSYNIDLSSLKSAIEFDDEGPCQFIADNDSIFAKKSDKKYLRSSATDVLKDNGNDVAYSHLIFLDENSYPVEYLNKYGRQN